MSYGTAEQKPRPAAAQKYVLTSADADKIVLFLASKDQDSPWTKEEILHLWEGMPERITLYDFRSLLYFCKVNALDPGRDEVFVDYKWGGDTVNKHVFSKQIRIEAYRRLGAEKLDYQLETFGKDHIGEYTESSIRLKGTSGPTIARLYMAEYMKVGKSVAKSMPWAMCSKACEVRAWKKVGILSGGDPEEEDYFRDTAPTDTAAPGAENVAGYSIGAKTEPKQEPKPEAKAEPKAETKPEPKADPPAATKAEPKADVKPEVKTEPKQEPKAEPKPETKPETKTEPQADPVTIAKQFFTMGSIEKRAAADFWKAYLKQDKLPGGTDAYMAGGRLLGQIMDTAAAKRAAFDTTLFANQLRDGLIPVPFGQGPNLDALKERYAGAEVSPELLSASAVLMDALSMKSPDELRPFLQQAELLVASEADQCAYLEIAAVTRNYQTLLEASKKSKTPVYLYVDAIRERVGGNLRNRPMADIEACMTDVISNPPSANREMFA